MMTLEYGNSSTRVYLFYSAHEKDTKYRIREIVASNDMALVVFIQGKEQECKKVCKIQNVPTATNK